MYIYYDGPYRDIGSILLCMFYMNMNLEHSVTIIISLILMILVSYFCLFLVADGREDKLLPILVFIHGEQYYNNDDFVSFISLIHWKEKSNKKCH